MTLTASNAYGSDGETKTGYISVTDPSDLYASLPFSEGFESGVLSQYWTTASPSPGRIQVTTANTPHSGTRHLTMDVSTNGTYAQNEAWLHLNLAGAGQTDLSFWWKEFGDETHAQDGIYFSDNGGASFVKVQDLNGASYTNATWNQFTLDVDALCAANGLSLSGTFVVKFQQYDNYAIATDGFAFDDISVTSTTGTAPVAAFSGTPTTGTAPLAVQFTDASTNAPTAWSWTFGDGGTSTAQNPSHTYAAAGTYSVTLTASNAFGSNQLTKTNYITVDPAPAGVWETITYDDFESGLGSWTDGGADCARYTGGTYAYQGSAAMDIQDNSGTASSFYHTASYNVTGYSELEVEFYFYAVSMETNEDFWVQYYDGSTWQTVASFASGSSFSNNTFYTTTVTIPSASYNFPANAKIRFMCDASGNADDVYIDQITFRGLTGTPAGAGGPVVADGGVPLPKEFAANQNYPNPFNPSTTIEFALPHSERVDITVYDLRGAKVATLASEVFPAGVHSVVWTADRQASGVYFYTIRAGDFTATKRMTLVK
ncbi:MAG TPA: PKD domain-containing protein [Candidatus Krumholzibacteria bacterium]|nr:PKD domain-containing protein [Candidatus Krumholzibacteria bacterium]